jgi:hypothetical protein
MEAKLRAAATAAAVESTTNERARCLWCIDQVIAELRTKLQGKLLSTVQIEAAKMKLRIAEAVCMELRRAIVSGVRPSLAPAQQGVTGQPGTAGFSPPSAPPSDA